MKRYLLLLIVLVLFVFTLSGCTKPVEENTEAVATYKDEFFEIELHSIKDVYSKNEPIDIYGTIKYIGEEDSIEIVHGIPAMVFSVVDSSGNDAMYSFIKEIEMYTVMEKDVLHDFHLIQSAYDTTSNTVRKVDDELYFSRGTYTVTFIAAFDFVVEGEWVDYDFELEYEFKVR